MSGILDFVPSAGASLTEKQRNIVNAYKKREELGAPPPTYRELCLEFGWGSTATARDHIRALVGKGFLTPARRRARGTGLGQVESQGRFVPLIGTIIAGTPVLSEENIERDILVPREFLPPGPAFILRVRGDSMATVGIFEKDLVIVHQTTNFLPDSVVAVTVDDESTLKFLREIAGEWWLVAANPKYSPIKVDTPALVHGVVTAVIRVIDNGTLKVLERHARRNPHRIRPDGVKDAGKEVDL